MTAMQAENTKLASNLESKLNKIIWESGRKTSLSFWEFRHQIKLGFWQLKCKDKFNYCEYNDRMRQEFSTQLNNEVQTIAKELEVVRKNTSMELTNFVRNFECVCETE